MTDRSVESTGAASAEHELSPSPPADGDPEVFSPERHPQRLLTARQVALWLRRSEAEVIADAEAGAIPGRMIDGRWRFGVASVNRWLEGPIGERAEETLADALQPILTELGSLRSAVEAVAARQARRGDDGLVVPTGQAIDFQLVQRLTIAELEEAYIRFVLHDCGENKTLAAKWLGIDPSTLHRKLALLEREKRDPSQSNP